MSTIGPAMLLAENSLFHAVGEVFHPIFVLFANILAYIYGVVPNYGVAIILLTIFIMALFTPLTVKSTKSMLAMQAIAPEAKKLQQKYKGPENREQLNRELMALYKEHGVSPVGGCLPMFIQMPFLIVLYDVIRGLTATTNGQATPDYISHNSELYKNLVASHGAMNAFGINLALKPFSHHNSLVEYIPYFAFIVVGVALQYLQMSQMTKRNPQAAQANKQMQMMQKVMPIFFAYIYFLVPVAVVLYMIVSTIIRIITQWVIFRMGLVQAPGKERSVSGARAPSGGAGEASGPFGAIRRGLGGAIPALSAERAAPGALPTATNGGQTATGSGCGASGTRSAGTAGSGAKSGSGGPPRTARKPAAAKPATPKPAANGAARSAGGNGRPTTSAKRPGASPGNGSARRAPTRAGGSRPKPSSGSGGGSGAQEAEKKPHPRAKDKRTRKAR